MAMNKAGPRNGATYRATRRNLAKKFRKALVGARTVSQAMDMRVGLRFVAARWTAA